MKVFISWSGESSHQVALALHRWLPTVIQTLDPWVSSEDIWKGQHWSVALSDELANTRAAILCLTRDNLDSRWLNFEAGALAKFLDTRVIPFLFNMKSTELSGPLSLLQYATFEPGHAGNVEDMAKILKALNESASPPLVRESILNDALEDRWKRLEDHLNGIAEVQEKATGSSRPQAPKTEDVLATLLDLVRGQGRELSTLRRDVSRLRRELRPASPITTYVDFLEALNLPESSEPVPRTPNVRNFLLHEYQRVWPAMRKALGRSPTIEELSGEIDVHPDLLRQFLAVLPSSEGRTPREGDPEVEHQ